MDPDNAEAELAKALLLIEPPLAKSPSMTLGGASGLLATAPA